MNPTADPMRSIAQFFRSEKGYRLIIDSLTEYAFIAFDTSNRISTWNSGAERVTGWAEHEILGQHGSVFFTPEDIAAGEVERELETARRDGRAEDERWHMRKDGNRFWASGLMFSVRGEDGALHGFVKIMRDLTEHKRHEEALRRSEERLRFLIENIHDFAIFDLDASGKISGWNPGAQRVFGYTPQEILGHSANRLYTSEDIDAGDVERELAEALEHGRAERARAMVRKHGERFFARWVTNPIRDAEARVRGFVKVLRDETAQRQLEEKNAWLQQLERELLEDTLRSTGRALASSKTELRSMTARLLLTQEEERRRIARELHDDIVQKLALLEIEITALYAQEETSVQGAIPVLARQIASLADDIRGVSHRLHPTILEDLGLESALGALVTDFEASRSAPVRFKKEPAPQNVPLEISAAVYGIAQEALNNVRKHAPHATVAVSLTFSGSAIELIVEDDGPGFDPNQKRRNQGLGIISMEERARLVGGSVKTTSAPGKGTIVAARVPFTSRAIDANTPLK